MRWRAARALLGAMRTSALPLLVILSACGTYYSKTVERGDPGQEISYVSRGDGTQIGYVADRSTETCWFVYGTEISPMHCCDTRKFKPITSLITWENDELCAARERARAGDLAAEPNALAAPPAPTKR
jgi:hypothetical protein